ncbi:MAG: phage tail tape measure protein, partial [Erysipelotrichaceae bacterium]
MAKKIKGLTVQIGGDTTELSKALKEPNKEASTLQSKLNAVNKSLKLDPTNTEILAQKQRILGKELDAVKSKLSLLKQAQKEFNEAGIDVDSSEYIELQKQILETENKLKSLNREQTIV